MKPARLAALAAIIGATGAGAVAVRASGPTPVRVATTRAAVAAATPIPTLMTEEGGGAAGGTAPANAAAPLLLPGPIATATPTPDPTFFPYMVPETAAMAATVSPPLASLTDVAANRQGAAWTDEECAWITDMLYADYQLDRASSNGSWNPGTVWFYRGAASKWELGINLANGQCQNVRPVWMNPELAATEVLDMRGAETGHEQNYRGASDTWDRNWADSYLEAIALFEEFPCVHAYELKLEGYGDQAC